MLQHDLLHSLEINFDKERGTIQEEMYDVAVSCVVELDKLEHVPNVDPRLRGNPNDYEYVNMCACYYVTDWMEGINILAVKT